MTVKKISSSNGEDKKDDEVMETSPGRSLAAGKLGGPDKGPYPIHT